jgi:hypothetical protein
MQVFLLKNFSGTKSVSVLAIESEDVGATIKILKIRV